VRAEEQRRSLAPVARRRPEEFAVLPERIRRLQGLALGNVHAVTTRTGAGVAFSIIDNDWGGSHLEVIMKFKIAFCAMTMLGIGAAQAQVDLSTYADPNGNLDVQALTCAQLAGTWQEDADFLTVWYSGWYNGLADYSKLKVDRAKELEHRVIVYCKANPKVKVIKAMDINIKQMRKEAGIKVEDEK
jgi:hypothetical protein